MPGNGAKDYKRKRKDKRTSAERKEVARKAQETRKARLAFIRLSLSVDVMPDPTLIHGFQNWWNGIARLQPANREGKIAWGEINATSLARTMATVNELVPFEKDDLIFDWGAGAGKLMLAAHWFAPVRIRTMGVEIDKGQSVALARNLLCALGELESECGQMHSMADAYHEATGQKMPRIKMAIRAGDSTTIHNFAPAKYIIQYDGPTSGAASGFSQYHKDIMTHAMRSPSMQLVASTKMDEGLFRDYFEEDEPGIFKQWKVFVVPKLTAEKQSIRMHIWVNQVNLVDVDDTPTNPMVREMLDVLKQKKTARRADMKEQYRLAQVRWH